MHQVISGGKPKLWRATVCRRYASGFALKNCRFEAAIALCKVVYVSSSAGAPPPEKRRRPSAAEPPAAEPPAAEPEEQH